MFHNNQNRIKTILTAKGREQLSKGELTFKYYSLSDSMYDYGFTNITQKTLRPLEFHPQFYSNIENLNNSYLNEITTELTSTECCFNSPIPITDFLTDELRYKESGDVSSNIFNGSNQLNLPLSPSNFDNGDIIELHYFNTSIVDFDTPHQILYFKITKIPASTLVILDRPLPLYVHDVYTTKFHIISNEPLIDENTPTFNEKTQVFEKDLDCVTGFNMDIVWNENIAGQIDSLIGFEEQATSCYINMFEYLGYNSSNCLIVEDDCQTVLMGSIEKIPKAIGIIHSTLYDSLLGQKYLVDVDNKITLTIPNIMWHGRQVFDSNVVMGMTFETDPIIKFTDTNQEYYNLIEDATLITTNRTPKVIGRVYHNLKLIVIDDEELLAAISFKSGRNYSLPSLKGNLINSSLGVNEGLLQPDSSIYMTYALLSNNGNLLPLPQQRYLKFDNKTKLPKDIQFTIEDINYLNYMQQIETNTFDGTGFYAHQFVVLYQIVDNHVDRPNPNNWKAVDFTLNSLRGGNSLNSINPEFLESQNPLDHKFILTKNRILTETGFSLENYGFPYKNCSNVLTLGAENVFFGDIEGKICSCVYETNLDVIIDSESLIKSNKNIELNEDLRVTAVGIYDDKGNLVIVSTLSNAIQIIKGQKINMKIKLNF